MTAITTRKPVPSDAPRIIAIDAQGLATGHASFRDKPHDWDSFAASFLSGRGLGLVAEMSDGIAAWAGLSPTSTRAVYHGVGEVSIYVSSETLRRGVGLLDLGCADFSGERG